MAFDVYSLGRSLLQMLTGHGPGHPVYQSVECGSDLRDEEPPATDDEDDQALRDAAAAEAVAVGLRRSGGRCD